MILGMLLELKEINGAEYTIANNLAKEPAFA